MTAPNNGDATVRLTFSTVLPSDFTVYKVDLSGDYTPIPENTGSEGFWVKVDANTLDITLKDNGSFDLNTTLGIIDDPIVISIQAITTTVQPIPLLYQL